MGRRSQGRGGGRTRSNNGQGPVQPTAESTLAEAETLQQRAERQNGGAAIAAYCQAAEKFRQAIGMGLPPAQQTEAAFGLGESLQLQADTVQAVARESADADLSAAAEAAAATQAASIYEQAVQAFRQVGSGRPDGALRVDAAVNCANALCSWAEAAGGEAALQLLHEAVTCYEMGLAQEDDALTWSNLADALVQLVEAAKQLGRSQDAEAAAARALHAYRTACSKSDSANGDDLPGLLHNWGAGLYTLAMSVQDSNTKASMLQEAVGKLQHSMQFERADAAPCIVLGDVLSELAELAQEPSLKVELLLRALGEGYQAALNIRRYEAGALVGVAEVKSSLAKLAVAGQLPGSDPAALMHESAVMYRSAMSHLSSVGGHSERNEVRYNYACVLAQLGQYEAARQLLEELKHNGGLDIGHVSADADLAALSQHDWFQQLLHN